MKPEFISHPVHIGSYPVLLLLGFFFGYLLARWRATFHGLAGRHVDNIALLLLVAGPFGARLFSRLFEMHLDLFDALKVLNGGGLVFYGGFILSTLVVIAYAIIARIPILTLFDIAAPSAALGLALGRIGCFMAGCCWGDLCIDTSQIERVPDRAAIYQVWTVPMLSPARFPLAVNFPEGSDVYLQHQQLGLLSKNAGRSLPVHPVQLYESALAFLLCVALARLKSNQSGEAFLGLLLGYAAIRFMIEFLRADNSPSYWGVTFSQLISILIVVLSALAILGRKMRFLFAPVPVPAIWP